MNRSKGGCGIFDRSVHGIVGEVARLEGVEATDLPPLNDVCDPDALSVLVDSPAHSDLTVKFTYCGYRVTVNSDDRVSVADEQDSSNVTLNAGEH